MNLARLFFFSSILCTFATADTLSFTGLQPDPTTQIVRSPPAIYSIEVPQFNPALGTLESIHYSFSDVQIVEFAANDDTDPIGAPFTITVTPLGVSDTLDFEVTKTPQSDIYFVTGIRQVGMPLEGDTFILSNSGTLIPADAFLGTGALAVDFTSNPTVSSPDASAIGVNVRLFSVQDIPALDISYEYTSVPEPRALFLIGLATLLIARFRRVHRIG